MTLLNLKVGADLPRPIQNLSGDGAITIKDGYVLITKGSAAAITLPAPLAGDPKSGGDDGKRLTILSTTAFAHTVTISNGLSGAGAAADVGTFGAAANNGVELFAYSGAWYPVPAGNLNVTWA